MCLVDYQRLINIYISSPSLVIIFLMMSPIILTKHNLREAFALAHGLRAHSHQDGDHMMASSSMVVDA